MKQVVSVSLWGNDLRYVKGAIKNAHLAAEHYPDWEFRIYAEPSLHEYLKGIPAVVLPPTEGWNNGRFWRFSPAFESDVKVMISRDCDSRISRREASCVSEWLASDKKFHVIRDHVRHYDFPILAGMWGVRDGLPFNIRGTIAEWAKDASAYLVDQIWLRDEIWLGTNARANVFVHGEQENTLISNRTLDFVGQGYDENDNPIYTHL
jgi:hypothetical protein